MDFDLGLERGDGGHQADDVGGARHIGLHVAHAGGGFDAKTTAVERQALAHDRDLALGAFRRRVDHVHHARIVAAAAADRHDQVGTDTLEPTAVEHRGLHVVALRDLHQRVGKRYGRELVRRLVLQIASDADRLADRGAERDGALGAIGARAFALRRDERDAGELALGALVTGEILGEPVGAEHDAFGEIAGAFAGDSRRHRDRERRGLVAERGFRRRRTIETNVGIGKRALRAETDQYQTSRGQAPERRDRETLVFLAAKLLALDELRQAAAERPLQLREGRRIGRRAFEHPHHEQVGLGLERVGGKRAGS